MSDPRVLQLDAAVAANITGQLGSMFSRGALPRKPPPGHMRGVDFYSASELMYVLAANAQIFRRTHGYLPLLEAPVSFTEHLFSRKFLAPLPVPSLADKLAARDYVRTRVGEAMLTRVIWIGNDAGELFSASLPPGRFVLKSNHGSGFNLFLNLPQDLAARRAEIETRTKEWLAARFGYGTGEWQYCTFKPRLFLEEFIDFSGDAAPDEYKIFCFHGKACMINFHTGRFTSHKSALYDTEWKLLPVDFGRPPALRERPDNLAHILDAAEAISGGLIFARVDLYSDCKQTVKFGEITFIPGNGLDRFSDVQFDIALGRKFQQGNREQVAQHSP